ncbi:cysteine dioxygenase [Pseudonocardia sp. TRM90224]|uniref:cysteine dioxygenase n=1 Tax=Pseudonocardia sp. TRM90224 TaxID=2812678 RepID=UPI001E5BF62E|nr:cysteine dioxygenase [Pseudonocardia sp. TRM90224]
MTAIADRPVRPAGMTRAELQQHVMDLAAHPEKWRHLVSFESDGRHYVSLHRDGVLDVWLLCWKGAADDTGWHDHDASSGAVVVVDGVVRQSTLRLAGEPLLEDFAESESFTFGPDHIHRMAGVAATSVTIHAYSPPLTKMGQYSFGDDGVLRRTSVDYEEELRPR